MTVFVETVFVENLIVDLFLLWLTSKTLNRRQSWQNLFMAAGFGSVFAILSSNLAVSGVVALGLKLSVAFLMCVSLDFSFNKILQKTGLFLFYTFCFGGLLIAIFWFLGKPTNADLGLICSTNLPVGAILVLVLVFCYLCFCGIKKFYKKQKIDKFCYDLKLTIFGKEIVLKGFLDTGNSVFDSQNNPVLITNKKHLKVLLEKDFDKFLNCPYELINIKSVSGSKQVLVFRPDKCEFDGKTKNVAIGLCDDNLFVKSDFDVILNPKLLEV